MNFLDIGVKSANMHLILPLGSAGKNVALSYKLAVNIFTELYVGSKKLSKSHFPSFYSLSFAQRTPVQCLSGYYHIKDGHLLTLGHPLK